MGAEGRLISLIRIMGIIMTNLQSGSEVHCYTAILQCRHTLVLTNLIVEI